jgi:hypothetical protein
MSAVRLRCTLHDVGEHGDSTYLVMEHLAGETLGERLQIDTVRVVGVA